MVAVCGLSLSFTGCQKGQQAMQKGARAQVAENYDAALDEYQKSVKQDPLNAQYKMRSLQTTFEASQLHVTRGLKLLEEQKNDLALKEFETALSIDPSSMVARQEVEYTHRLLASAKPGPPGAPAASSPANDGLMEAPPSLAPLSREPITLKMSAESKVVFRTIGKLAGVNVIFDPEFTDRKINVDLVNVTIQQAMNVASVEGKAFWKPISTNIILVMPDTPPKRKEQEEQVLQKIYLEHTQSAQELTEIMTGVQGMLELRHVQAVPRDNAILVRDTPAKVLLATRLIRDSDRGRAEVVVQISVLQVRRDRARSLGIQPSTSATINFNPAAALGTGGGVSLSKLAKIAEDDYTVTIPNAVASALYSDSNTRIIQNPEVRVSDGESACLRVGDRIPIATGSFQALAGSGPAINTQFQYIDVGVNVDMTPTIHNDRDVTMKLSVEVSSESGTSTIDGVVEPVISQEKVEQVIRLKDGEVSILAGLVQKEITRSISGWPGLGELPGIKYMFSTQQNERVNDELVFMLIPHVVRAVKIDAGAAREIDTGSGESIRIERIPFQPTQTNVTNPKK